MSVHALGQTPLVNGVKVHPHRGFLCCRPTICGKMSLAVTSGASAYADGGRSFCESMLDKEK
ncbi:hypothetical protein [Paenibacillus pabuli]|uniref:hypothetical protein n=1 Tax=Paenibacillus pabuli TaxID=1472 RepID=UPI001C3F3BD4|nr:hypothetical protein [Paenibacillus pabuli]